MRYLIFFAFFGCGQIVNVDYGTDSEFRPCLDQIERLYTEHTNKPIDINEDIIFAELPHLRLGRCAWTDENRENSVIIINNRHWGELSDHRKVLVLLHELGHCAWRLGHDETPKSIMNSYIPGFHYLSHDETIQLNEVQYKAALKRFFNKVNAK